MHEYKVGQPYNPKLRHWPEGAQFNVRRGVPELILALRGVRSTERRAVKAGTAEFAVFAEGDQIFLLYRFDPAIPWSDAPFTAHKLPAEERELLNLDELEPGQAIVFYIFLVEATTGIIEAMRLISLPLEFMRALYDAIQQQLALPFAGQATYDQHLSQTYVRYPESVRMLPQAAARYRSERGRGE